MLLKHAVYLYRTCRHNTHIVKHIPHHFARSGSIWKRRLSQSYRIYYTTQRTRCGVATAALHRRRGNHRGRRWLYRDATLEKPGGEEVSAQAHRSLPGDKLCGESCTQTSRLMEAHLQVPLKKQQNTKHVRTCIHAKIQCCVSVPCSTEHENSTSTCGYLYT